MTGFDGYLFDLDGTLWDATEPTWRIWCETITGAGYAPVTLEAVMGVMGLPMDALFDKLLPHIPADRRGELCRICMAREIAYLYDHGGKLYPGVEETLRLLSHRAPLYIVSNCQSGYIEAFLHAHALGALFSDHSCFGDNGLGKGENIRLLINRHGLSRPVYVGDTALDQAGAAAAGVPFIHAAYGFGKVPDAAMRIGAFSELQ